MATTGTTSPDVATDPLSVGPRIRMLLPTLTPAEQAVAAWLLKRGNLTGSPKIGEVAAVLRVSEAMLVKVARRLGYAGFKGLRADLVAYHGLRHVAIDEELSQTDEVGEILRKIFLANRSALEEVESVIDVPAIEEASRIFMAARQRDLYGVGGSATVCADAAHKFLRIGVRSSIFSDAHLIRMSASLLDERDAVLAISHSGETRDVLHGVELARRTGAKVIALTNSFASTLARNADVVLCAPAKESPLMGQNAAARIAQLTIVDTLFICLARVNYEAAEENLNKTMSSVSIYSEKGGAKAERRAVRSRKT